MLKKALYLLLTLVFIINCVNIEVFAIRGYQSIWIEAEDTEFTGFGVRTNSSAYGGSHLWSFLNDMPNNCPEIKAPFQISVEQNYDIWALVLTPNVSHISKIQWSIDGSEYADFKNSDIGSSMFADTQYGLGFNWCKLDTRVLERGKHSISLVVPEHRGLDSKVIQGCDALAVVPAEWEWAPNTGNPPYKRSTVKAEYVGGSVDKELYQRKETITIEVSNKVKERVTGELKIYAQLERKGEVVYKVVKSPEVPINTWTPGYEYTDSFELEVPFNAAFGEHQVTTGIVGADYDNGEAFATVSNVYIGSKEHKNPEMKTITTGNISFPADISADVPFEVSLKATSNTAIDYDTTAYVALWKEDVLWGVLEGSETVETSKWIPGEENELSCSFTVTEAIPKGAYTATVGLHKTKLMQNDVINVNLVKSKPNVGEHYKPMSYGFLDSEKSGNCHFWYVNQTFTKIRDGVPYIPLGGMVAFDYLCYFDVNNPANNEKNFQADLEFIGRLVEHNVTDIYINSRGFNIDYPTWAFEYLFAVLDEKGINYSIQLNDRLDRARHDFEAYYIRGIDNGRATVRVKDVTESGTVTLDAPGNGFANYANPEGTAVKFIVIDQETQNAVQNGDGKIESLGGGNWRFSAEVELPEGEGKAYTVAFTPKFKGRPTSNFSNFLEFGDITVKNVGEFAERLEVGDGFTMWIDLCFNESSYANDMESARVFNDTANEKYAKFLETRYRTIDVLNDSWKITPALESFEKAALIIPLYTTDKDEAGGYGTYAADAYTNELYYSDTYNSRMWSDFTDFVSEKHRDFDNDMAEAVKKYIDTPVVYKMTDSYSSYRIATSENYGFDGIGCETYGATPKSMGRNGSYYSQANASKKTVWLVVTETNTEENINLKYESGETSYPTEEYMHDHFNLLLDTGAKGIYDFLISNNNSGIIIQAYAYETKPALYEWANNYRKILTQPSRVKELVKSKYVYDHGYMYPAADAWWYKPNIFTAVHYDGDMVNRSYPRVTSDFVLLPLMDPWIDTELLVTNMSDAPASRLYGPSLCEMLRSRPEYKKVVFMGARKDLGAVPEIDKYYTSETDVNADGMTVQVLKPTATSEVLATTDKGNAWALRDGNLWIIAVEDWMFDSDIEDAKNEFSKVGYISDFGILEADTVAVNPTFSDIDGHWAKDEILKAAKAGFVKGVEEGIYDPDSEVTRSQFVAMIVRALKEKNIFYDLTLYKGIANDVNPDDWFATYLQQAYDLGYINDELLNGNVFKPENAITREEMADIIVRVYDKKCGIAPSGNSASFADSGSIADWTKASVNKASALELMEGVGEQKFSPKGNVTRAQAVAAITRLLATLGTE